MKDEIDRTHDMQLQVMRTNPEWIRWHNELLDVKGQLTEREGQRKGEVEALKYEQKTIRADLEVKRRQVYEMRAEEEHLLGELHEMENTQKSREFQEAERGEAEAQARLDSLNKKIMSLNGDEEELHQGLRRMEKKHAEVQGSVCKLRQHYSSLERQRETVGAEYEETLDKIRKFTETKNTALKAFEKARQIEYDADQAIAEHPSRFDTLKSSLQRGTEKVRRAREVMHKAFALKKQAAVLHEQQKERLRVMHSSSQTLLQSRDEIQEKVAALLREQALITDQLDRNIREETNLETEMMHLKKDYDVADEYFNSALHIVSQTEEGQRCAEHEFTNESDSMKRLLGKRSEANSQKRQAEKIFHEAESSLQSMEPKKYERARLFKDLQEQLDEYRSLIAGAEKEKSQVESSIQFEQRRAEDIPKKRNSLHEDIDTVRSIMMRCQEVKRDVQVRLGAIRDNIDSIRPTLEAKIKKTQGDIWEMERRFEDLEVKLAGGESAEMDFLTSKLRSLYGERGEVEQKVKDVVMFNPPAELKSQLAREAEAVMRAELASGLYTRQEKIERDARSLATLKVDSVPRIVMDEEATEKLVSQHMESPDYREVAGSVVELTEQNRIMAK